ncbi:glycine zipper family protein [Silvanigrella paludirubra]|uniref:Glycine zipper family protein n=1 Tax=Silvanigrella paludirubra TaxID=2499159 RepID=A0A6N6VR88_9BACT|nr:glycine zipper family protein [Silvanigrella paludirubra]KAB8037862.1 glycine zipper family protein [Silvanigrella paludirubra]
MSNNEFKTKTNTEKDSKFDITDYLMPARGFFFVIVEELGKDGFLVRRTYATLDDPYLREMNLSYSQNLREVWPEKYNLEPRNYSSTSSIAEHIMGSTNKNSSYISTSSSFPDGSPRFDVNKKTVYIDINKAKKAGAKLISTEEILSSLEEYKQQNPHLKRRIDKIAGYVKDIDKEVLLQGKKIPSKAVFTPNSYDKAMKINGIGKVLHVFGIAFTAYDLKQALDESYKVESLKPITAEVVRQAGGWGAAWVGFKIGGAIGVSVGIEAGPGCVISGLVGGVIFGTSGYFGFDWVADFIYKN